MKDENNSELPPCPPLVAPGTNRRSGYGFAPTFCAFKLFVEFFIQDQTHPRPSGPQSPDAPP
jgi:hypothetical protein